MKKVVLIFGIFLGLFFVSSVYACCFNLSNDSFTRRNGNNSYSNQQGNSNGYHNCIENNCNGECPYYNNHNHNNHRGYHHRYNQ